MLEIIKQSGSFHWERIVRIMNNEKKSLPSCPNFKEEDVETMYTFLMRRLSECKIQPRLEFPDFNADWLPPDEKIDSVIDLLYSDVNVDGIEPGKHIFLLYVFATF
jgi:hypothetical protein